MTTREQVFHFAFDRKAPRRGLGKNQSLVRDHVKLAGFPRFDPGVNTKTLLD